MTQGQWVSKREARSVVASTIRALTSSCARSLFAYNDPSTRSVYDPLTLPATLLTCSSPLLPRKTTPTRSTPTWMLCSSEGRYFPRFPHATPPSARLAAALMSSLFDDGCCWWWLLTVWQEKARVRAVCVSHGCARVVHADHVCVSTQLHATPQHSKDSRATVVATSTECAPPTLLLQPTHLSLASALLIAASTPATPDRSVRRPTSARDSSARCWEAVVCVCVCVCWYR